jgi:RimJ/RimL family protein N-acetyltransferase
MNDLFVAEGSRGAGVAEILIEACRQECASRGVRRLAGQTAPENRRAQAVYERIGATREQWVDSGWQPTRLPTIPMKEKIAMLLVIGVLGGERHG